MVENKPAYWAQRIVNIATGDPNVNQLDKEELREHTKEMCDRLCLNEEAIIPEAEEIRKDMEIMVEENVPEDDAMIL